MKIYKIFLIIILAFASQAAWAECELKEFGMGKEFSIAQKKFKLNEDGFGDKKYTKNIKGQKICDELAGAEVSFLFLQDKLARIEIYKKSPTTALFAISSRNFGEPRDQMKQGDNSATSFTTIWDKNKNIVTYNYSYSSQNNLYAEKLVIVNKELSDKIGELNSVKEDQ